MNPAEFDRQLAACYDAAFDVEVALDSPEVQESCEQTRAVLLAIATARLQAMKHPKMDDLIALQLRVLQKLSSVAQRAFMPSDTTGKIPPPPARDESSLIRGIFRVNAGTFVYVARNAKAEIIYVGVTDDLFGRMAAHKTTRRWWDQMASIEWTEWPDRTTALKQEARVIAQYRPKFNIVHNPDARRAV